MWNRLRILGPLSVALLCGTSLSFAGELTNVTLGRSQDFTVVTLYGDGPMSVTHQIVEAKDGKPHRIVVDITGALHKLPQNNFADLPEGSITTIRTSQFAVSPEPVVRVVLDLAHPAAYRLETPENQVRVMVSLPGDPPLAKVWSARDGGMNSEPFETPVTFAEAGNVQASESTELAATETAATETAATETAATEAVVAETATEAAASPADQPNDQGALPQVAESSAAASENATETPESRSEPAEPGSPEQTPGWNNPAKSAEPEGEIKSLPVAPTGKLALASDEGPAAEAATDGTTEAATSEGEPPAEAKTSPDPSSQMENTANPEPAAADAGNTEAAQAEAAQAQSDVSPVEFAAGGPAIDAAQESSAQPEPETQASEPEADGPQIPMPDHAIQQPERVIDYNLPVPAGFAGSVAETEAANADGSAFEADAEVAPKLAVKSSPADGVSGASSSDTPEGAVNAPTGSDAAVSDSGSAPVASLTTLPPLSESAAELVPQRTQVIYHTQGRRDPFKALLQSGGYNAAALPDVSSLRLVGLLHDMQEAWGLFEDANGYGYILKKGDRVKNGSLTQFTNNRAYFNLTEFGWSRSVHIDLEPEG